MLALFSLAVTLPNPSWQEEATAGGAASDGSDSGKDESGESSVLSSKLSEDTESESRVCDDESDHSDGTSPLPPPPSFHGPHEKCIGSQKKVWETVRFLHQTARSTPAVFAPRDFFTKS